MLIREVDQPPFADRASCTRDMAGWFRFLLASAAWVINEHLRREGLKGTDARRAQVGAVRLKLLEVAAGVVVIDFPVGLLRAVSRVWPTRKSVPQTYSTGC